MKKTSFLLVLLMLFMTFPAIQVFAAHNPYVGIKIPDYDEVVSDSSGVSSDTRGFVRNLRGSAYLVFKDVDFGENGPKSVEFSAATGVDNAGVVSLYVDDPNGVPIATFETVEGDWVTPVVSSDDIEVEITGVHNIYIKSTTGVCNMYSLMFYEKVKAGVGVVYKEGDYFDDIAYSPYKNEINMFHEMGILNGFSETKYEPRLYMNRGDFATVMYRIIGNDGVSGVPFLDVPIDDKNSQAVSWMFGAGLITGDGNSMYRPYDFITAQEAATIAVRALGFERLAQEYGGFPNGYMAVATNEDLFDNITVNKLLTREQIAMFLYNFIHADYLDIDTITSNGVKYIKKNGVVGRDKGIYSGTGMVTATTITGLKVTETGLLDTYVTIDGENYNVGDTAAAGLLGYETDFYYREVDNEKILTNIRPSANSVVTKLTTDTSFIGSISESGIEYYDENGKPRKLKFDNDTAFIYNGKAADKPLSELIADGDFLGRVTYIKNDGTDVVLIEQHETVFVGAVNMMDYIIYNEDFSKSYCFDSEKADVTIMLNSEPHALAQISSGAVLSVFESENENGKKRIIAYVEENSVSGSITHISDNTVTINGTEYETAMVNGPKLVLGLEGKFYINYLGTIVAYESDSFLQSGMKIGMLLDYGDFSSGLIKESKLKIFTTDNVTETYICADRMTADGVVIDTKSNLLTGYGDYIGLNSVSKKTLVRYKLNADGKVSVIDTCLEGAGGEYDKLVKISTESNRYYFNTYTHSFLGTKGKTLFVYDDSPEAFVFGVGQNEERLKYHANMMSLISREASATGDVYSITDSITADYFVWTDRISNVSVKYSKPFVFEKMISILDDNNDEAYVIRGYTGASSVEYTITLDFLNDSENNTFNTVINSLRVGDVVRFVLDLDGAPLEAEIVYLRDGASQINGITPLVTNENQIKEYDQYQRERIAVGEVISVDGNIATVRCNLDGESVYEMIYFGNSDITVYDASTEKITTGLSTSNMLIGSKVLIAIGDSTASLILRYDEQ